MPDHKSTQRYKGSFPNFIKLALNLNFHLVSNEGALGWRGLGEIAQIVQANTAKTHKASDTEGKLFFLEENGRVRGSEVSILQVG